MNNLPKQTGDIFEILSKGQFICSDSSKDHIRKLYTVLDEHPELVEYYQAIKFNLENGGEYFFFSRSELRVDLERKIEMAYRWIDIVDFFKTFEETFGPGYHFIPSDILVKLNVDAVLKTKLEGLKKYSKEDSFDDSLRKILEMLEKENFIELQNEISKSYKVLSSFKFLEDLILAINIPEETKDEIPE